jgi:glycosyltransferase involved in cell wall biosynthesis
MKFVWVTREVPLTPVHGAHSYSNGLLRGLLGAGAVGDLVSYDLPGGSAVRIDGLTQRLSPAPAPPRALSLLTSLPSDAYRLKSKGLARNLEAALQGSPDAVLIDFYAMGWVAPILRRHRATAPGRPPRLVYVSHQYEQELRAEVARDHVGSPAMRLALSLDAYKAAQLERRLVADCDLITAITERDREKFLQDAPTTPVLTLSPGYEGAPAPAWRIGPDTPRQVILAGAFNWIAKKRNFRRFLDAAEGPFREAGIKILLVGQAEPDFIAEIMGRSQICAFTGFVPEIAPYLQQGRIGLMPDEVGGGFKLKYLDYVFASLPIATIASQLSDLPIDPTTDVITAPTAAELVTAIVGAIDDFPRLNAMKTRALAACSGAFQWADRGRKLAEALGSIVQTSSPPRVS